MHFICSVLLASTYLLAVITAAPSTLPHSEPTTTEQPSWHRPCGRNGYSELSQEYLEMDNNDSLNRLKLQHQQAMREFLDRDYEYLYEKAKFAFHENQYVTPHWLPGKREILRIIRKIAKRDEQTIIHHLPKLHRDLQKFAVALEPMVKDEKTAKVQDALRNTQLYLLTTLCEVENSIESHSNVRLPERIPRSIMSTAEREPIDDTQRLLRDWSILVKYKDYLHAWRHVFDY